MNAPAPDVITQHLIDPEVCIRCNTCEETCPVDAITHDSRNYVVDADKCNLCMACVPPCPTGSIDNWRKLIRVEAYSVDEQLTWDELPVQRELPVQDGSSSVAGQAQADASASDSAQAPASAADDSLAPAPALASAAGASRPPWSAAHPYVNLYTHRQPVMATVAGNFRVTELGTDSDTHHIVLDFGSLPFPVLEGQSLGILPPGTDATGRPHHARQYSIASPRDGERPGYNNVALTVKRVLVDHDGQPVRGVASNYLCDLAKGDRVQVIGPFGSSFLMPNHAGAHLLMICTGTGSAPMRAMTERRRRAHAPIGGGVSAAGAAGSPDGQAAEDGRLMLFFGARSQRELPYSVLSPGCRAISSTSSWPIRGLPTIRSAMFRTRCANARATWPRCWPIRPRTSMSAVSRRWRPGCSRRCRRSRGGTASIGRRCTSSSRQKVGCISRPTDDLRRSVRGLESLAHRPR